MPEHDSLTVNFVCLQMVEINATQHTFEVGSPRVKTVLLYFYYSFLRAVSSETPISLATLRAFGHFLALNFLT